MNNPARKLKLSALLGIILLTANAFALDVPGAYRAIPHRQTTYSSSQSTLSAQESQQLAALFELVDAALVQRIATLQWFESSGKNGQSIEQYRAKMADIQASIKILELPAKADQPRLLILLALRRQGAYFDERALSRGVLSRISEWFSPPQHIQDSHHALIQAYNELMAAFPSEGNHNKQAFFDHLCALDFI